MINLKKLDEIDIEFVNKNFTEKETIDFCNFLRNRKIKKKSANFFPTKTINNLLKPTI
jgi:hypothetical protein